MPQVALRTTPRAATKEVHKTKVMKTHSQANNSALETCIILTITLVIWFAQLLQQTYMSIATKFEDLVHSSHKSMRNKTKIKKERGRSWAWCRRIKRKHIKYSLLRYVHFHCCFKKPISFPEQASRDILQSSYLKNIPVSKTYGNKNIVKKVEKAKIVKAQLKKMAFHEKRKLKYLNRLAKVKRFIRSIFCPSEEQESIPIKLTGTRPTIEVTIGLSPITFLLDSGSQVNVISSNTLKILEAKERFVRIENPLRLVDQSNNTIPTSEAVEIPLTMNSERGSRTVLVPFVVQVGGTLASNLLGTQFMDQLSVSLTFTGKTVKLKTKEDGNIDRFDLYSDQKFDVYVKSNTELKPGKNLLEVTIQDPVQTTRIAHIAMQNTEGLFTPLSNLHNVNKKSISIEQVETNCNCAHCDNKREKQHDCISSPQAVTDSTFNEGLVSLKQYDFKVPVFKQINYGSNSLNAGQRIGYFSPYGRQLESCFSVQRIAHKRKIESTAANQSLMFPGGTVTRSEPQASTDTKKLYTVSFLTEVEGTLRCPLCRSDCKASEKQNNRKKQNKVFINTKAVSYTHLTLPTKRIV